MPQKLTDAEIKQKLQEGRNYKRLYLELKPRFDKVVEENRQLLQLAKELQKQNETQAIQIAELQEMVFGKKPKSPSGGHPAQSKPVPQPRSNDSYRRPLPPASVITSEELVPLPYECSCGGSFTHITTHERYEEDIPLPELTKDYQAHLVTKYIIERGVCETCGKATSGRGLGGQAVTLGPNIRLLLCHLVSVVGLSYDQVRQLALGLYSLQISDGDIAGVLAKQHTKWLPAYTQLQAAIRSGPSLHMDETAWPIQGLDGHGFAWVMASASSPQTCFMLAQSRGVPNAKALLSDYTGTRVTDDYGVYRSLPGSQQLCWAHLYRGIRDLRYNVNLPKKQVAYVTWWYEQFASIYAELRAYLEQPYDQAAREIQAEKLWQRVRLLCAPRKTEPAKLTKLKAQLLRAGQPKLFICLPQNIPCDNNRAERDLRPLVLKRKRSFGSKTAKGAQVLSTILSICTTTWRTNPNDYFKTLAAI